MATAKVKPSAKAKAPAQPVVLEPVRRFKAFGTVGKTTEQHAFINAKSRHFNPLTLKETSEGVFQLSKKGQPVPEQYKTQVKIDYLVRKNSAIATAKAIWVQSKKDVVRFQREVFECTDAIREAGAATTKGVLLENRLQKVQNQLSASTELVIIAKNKFENLVANALHNEQ